MRLNFDSLPLPKFKYSPAVRMGPFVKTAGMIGLDPMTQTLVNGGVHSEFRQILINLEGLMESNALSRSSLMSSNIFVTAFHNFSEINEIWDSFFASCETYPARTSVGVSQLPLRAQVEADFLFYVPTPHSKGGV